MTTTRIYYEYKVSETDKIELCFTCAVMKASAAKAIDRAHPGSISIQSCSYEYAACNECGCYLNDEVTL